jgi:mono/diheme cytochrome c family protein
MNRKVTTGIVLTCATVTVGAVIAASLLMVAQPAAATAQFATDTGKSCGACHTNPKGGGPLTALGSEFKANGNKMPSK